MQTNQQKDNNYLGLWGIRAQGENPPKCKENTQTATHVGSKSEHYQLTKIYSNTNPGSQVNH